MEQLNSVILRGIIRNSRIQNIGEIGFMILTPFWVQGIGAEAVR